jgi:bifunctional N-acetylglucosamine-1-phosphate-uridyltransferase/glucosamine-1-phosphate-acetyltransferase GlmU-like protein
MLGAEEYFDLNGFKHKNVFEGTEFVWEAIGKLKNYIENTISPNLNRLSGIAVNDTLVVADRYEHKAPCKITRGKISKGGLTVTANGQNVKGASVIDAGAFIYDENIYIGKGSLIESGALIKGPTIIGDNVEIRQGAYIRGNCIIGDNCVIGHATEIKNSIMLNGSKAAHFAYVGDSILGNDVNLGAGTRLANIYLKNIKIIISTKEKKYRTDLDKLGAILGDGTQTGCNCVCNPGTLVGKSSLIFPGVTVAAKTYPKGSRIGLNVTNLFEIR